MSTWVQELTCLASAVIRTAVHTHGTNQTCLHCLNTTQNGEAELFHEADCPVTYAKRVLRQAAQDIKDTGTAHRYS